MNRKFLRLGRRIGIAIAGGAVMLAGLVLCLPMVPGPGLLVILMGLGILSLEFERPRVWLAYLKAKGVALKDWFRRKRSRSSDES